MIFTVKGKRYRWKAGEFFCKLLATAVLVVLMAATMVAFAGGL